MIWLIGNKGMLGTEIARQLCDNQIPFCGTDIDVDITSIHALESFVQNKKIEWIINCAAYTAVDKAESETELAEKLNSLAPKNIALVAKKIDAKLIHISTDYVFDGKINTPRNENDTVSPIGCYGITKAKGEQNVLSTLNECYILRTAWLYGWAGKNFVYTMIKAMNSRDSVKVVSDQFGTPTFASDLANVILKIIEKGNIPFGIYHCTDLGETSWFLFTKEIKKQAVKYGILANTDCKVLSCTTEEYPTVAKRPQYSVLDKSKIQNSLEITLPQWQESLSKFLDSPLFDKSKLF